MLHAPAPTRIDFDDTQPLSVDHTRVELDHNTFYPSLPNADPTTDGRDVPSVERHETTELGIGVNSGETIDDEGNCTNPHLTRGGSY